MGRKRSKKRTRKPASLDVLDDVELPTGQEFVDPYEGANEAQRSVIAWQDGRVMVCAVPGSGKTFAVVRRMHRMNRDGVDVTRVLATTFTKRGAGEMNDRLARLGCPVGEGGARVGTFHSVCYEIIRDGSPWKGFEVDDGGMHYALKDILGYKRMNWKGADLSDVEGFIGACKNGLVAPQDVRVDRGAKPYDARSPGLTCDPRMGEAYFMYEEERERKGIITFDDMLKLSVEHLRADASARTRWAGRYDHVIVDEYQDTNLAQYELMKMLGGEAKSLMCVGDARQLIFGWRGSMLDLTLTFQEKFDAEIINMDVNYRSLPGILEPANMIGKTFPHPIMQGLAVPHRKGEATVQCRPTSDMDAEAQTVVERIMELHNDGVKYGDCAVMYRTRAQSRAYEEECIKRKIPHVVIGGTDFYSRKEIKDILAYVRLAVDGSNDKACGDCINRPFRYIGKVSVDSMKDASRGMGVSMLEIARECGRYDLGLQARQVTSVLNFVEVVDSLRHDLGRMKHREVDLPTALANLIRDTRYEDWIVGDEGSDTTENSRLSNLREMVRTSGRFGSAEKMLEYIDDLAKQRKKRRTKEGADLVQLQTIHKSKGLEWPAVFVAGCAEGILPHGRTEDIEEERRLFFVAITRARDYLMVTWPTSALVGGRETGLQASRFIKEAGMYPMGLAWVEASDGIESGQVEAYKAELEIGRKGG